MTYETNKIYTFVNEENVTKDFKFIMGDWVDMENGALYDTISLELLGWVILGN